MAPPTAYMLFCNENREAVRQKLVAAGHQKVAITLVAKELGQVWKGLSEEEKAAYKTRAEEQQQQEQVAEGDAQQGSPSGEQQQEVAGDLKAAALPSAWVRRVVGLDPEIQRCSADALLALSTAADVFLGAICAKATAAAAGAKRRTVRLDDIERCVRSDKRMTAVGLPAVLNMVSAAASNAAETKAVQLGNKKARLEGAAVNNNIMRAFGLAK
ncbi:hypothetical protein VOLCADRAFT_98278 [Volvox carteri f. nagariensis]|uniref:HMG box domain-containing protein n=1 Tax=Volvox carteri f. nagariensis TaxID=3068 RepID=D8UF18_VOLCA|nr:uncharacterized protein VOLCADRAFT_98278 [Volvox carteri f. nagariensis]EFJ41738.1 hypothetical protein VOLCADRAFT_98278 [Volvox carteri f. nagariensis]|eukprot:XP_002957240.1 hypothetical protein VOLCADRAFT_98278 [Volvox carteri f. nagariensis]